MIRSRRRLLGLMLVFALGGGLSSPAWHAARAQDLPLPHSNRIHDPAAGIATVRELLAAAPPTNLTFYGSLKIRDSEGIQRQIDFRNRVKLDAQGWESLYESHPSGSTPAQRLLVIHRGAEPNQYFFGKAASLEAIPPKLAAIPPESTFVPFAGSDFWFCDLGLEFLHWPQQVLVGREMVHSRSCRVIESTNLKPGPGDYGKVISWVDSEFGGIVQAEAYLPGSNRPFKEFSVRSLEKVNDQYQVKSMRMRNRQADTETVIEFNYYQGHGSGQNPGTAAP